MISYLVYSSISLGILLIFYHLFLEKEKMHKINRGYLLFSMFFSFIIPLIPVGVAELPIYVTNIFSQQSASSAPSLLEGGEWLLTDSPAAASAAESANGSGAGLIYPAIILTYFLVTGFLLIRFLRMIFSMQMKAERNEKRRFKGYQIVLLNEETAPHTFFSNIFLNKKEYLNREIPREVIAHERVHAKQKHTVDILLVEILKVLFWFNPLIYLCKKAILLNHEFLADEAVLAQGTALKKYQKLLLNSMIKSPAHVFASRFNYSLTKKRLQMMTQTKSYYRSALKLASLLPLIIALMLLPACEFATTEYEETETTGEVAIVIEGSSELLIDGSMVTIEELDRYLEANADDIEKINFEISPEAEFGLVTDIQKMLRNHGTMQIKYTVKSDDRQNGELERVTNEFLKAAESYMNIEPDPYSSYDQMKEKYEKVTDLFESIKVAMADEADAPPPPPMVPSPEERMMERTSGIHVEERNLMKVLLNNQGLLLINDEPTEIYEVKDRVKEFVDNRGVDPRLSDNPAEAILSVRTAKDTPYEIYKQLLDEIMLAYDELRDEAAQARFGTPYASLEENSQYRREIREIYPARISVKEPEQL